MKKEKAVFIPSPFNLPLSQSDDTLCITAVFLPHPKYNPSHLNVRLFLNKLQVSPTEFRPPAVPVAILVAILVAALAVTLAALPA
ncbi:MAG: hypothetical protein K2P38_16460, partial [Lachnospiraceae bacterium]|nr:hypothetical protein [Lachnospiraceae bacterium]